MGTPFDSVRLTEMMELEMTLPLFGTVPGLIISVFTSVPTGRLAVVPVGKVTDPTTLPFLSITSKMPSRIHRLQETEGEKVVVSLAGVEREGLAELLIGELFEMEGDSEGAGDLDEVSEWEGKSEREIDPDGESDGRKLADGESDGRKLAVFVGELDGLLESDLEEVAERELDSVMLSVMLAVGGGVSDGDSE